MSVTVTEVNDAPTAVDDTATVAEDGSVIIDPRTNDSRGPANESTQTLTVIAVGTRRTAPRRSLSAASTTARSVHAGGQLQRPRQLQLHRQDNGTTNGADDFKSDIGQVDVTVTEVNDAPTAVDDTATVAEDGSVVIDPRTNDSRGPANESAQTLTVIAVGSPAHGTAAFTVGGVNDGKILYTPAANYNGPDSFSYTVQDNGTTNGADDFKSDIRQVDVTVTEVNDAPTNASLSFDDDEIDENGSVAATLTFEDVEADQKHTCMFEWGDGATETVNLPQTSTPARRPTPISMTTPRRRPPTLIRSR